MSRAAQAKEFPGKPEVAMPELFEKKKGVKIKDLPPDLQADIRKDMETRINKAYRPMT